MDNLEEHRENLLSLLNDLEADEDTLVAVRNMDDEEMVSAFHKIKNAVFDGTAQEEEDTDVWYVYHHIHVQTPHKKKPKLFITDVPEDKEVGWDLVDEYGSFGEFGMKHANHGIGKLTPDSPKEVKRAWREIARRGIEKVTYDELRELRQSV